MLNQPKPLYTQDSSKKYVTNVNGNQEQQMEFQWRVKCLKARCGLK